MVANVTPPPQQLSSSAEAPRLVQVSTWSGGDYNLVFSQDVPEGTILYVPANTVVIPDGQTLTSVFVKVSRSPSEWPIGISMTIVGNHITIGGYAMAPDDFRNGDGLCVEMDFERHPMATVPVTMGAIYALL